MYDSGRASAAELKNNYIYISHLDEAPDKFWYLPMYPESISDNMQSRFPESNALGRTAPVFTYSNSGPRTVSVTLDFHRELFEEVNEMQLHNEIALKKPNGTKSEKYIDTDYVDDFIKALQAIAVPKFNLATKTVEPPLVALRLGNEIFIKGVVNGGINVTYGKPILYNNKYAKVTISLTISEVDPYDASSVYKNGSFRGYTRLLGSKKWTESKN